MLLERDPTIAKSLKGMFEPQKGYFRNCCTTHSQSRRNQFWVTFTYFLQFVRFQLWDSQMGFVAFQDTSLERNLTWVCFCLTAITAKVLRMFVFWSTGLELYCFFTLNSTHVLELGLESAEANSCWVKRLKLYQLNSAPTSFWRPKSQSYFSLRALTGMSHRILGWSVNKDLTSKNFTFYIVIWDFLEFCSSPVMSKCAPMM